MPVAADSRLVADAALVLLREAGLTVHDGEAPEGAAAPYGFLTDISDVFSGTLDAPSADAARTLQLTSVGSSPEQARWYADKAAMALLGADPRDVAIEGRVLLGPVRHVGGGRLTRDDDTAERALFGRADDYLFMTAPA